MRKRREEEEERERERERGEYGTLYKKRFISTYNNSHMHVINFVYLQVGGAMRSPFSPPPLKTAILCTVIIIANDEFNSAQYSNVKY